MSFRLVTESVTLNDLACTA